MTAVAAAVATAAEVGQRGEPEVDPFSHEQRYLVSSERAAAFLQAIEGRATVDTFDPVRVVSYARTTYFDTEDRYYFGSTTSPIGRRLRLREYALARDLDEPPILTGLCYLELKQQSGDKRSKLRLAGPPAMLERMVATSRAADPDPLSLFGTGGGEQHVAVRVLQRELREHCVAPRVGTWYRRVALSGEGGRVRITMDEGLTFFRPGALGAAGETAGPTGDIVAYGPPCVLEVKRIGAAPTWLAEATRGLLPAPRFSKFRMGMVAVDRDDAAGAPQAGGRKPPTLIVIPGNPTGRR